MTIIRELRIPLPMTVEEFQRGQLYCVAEASKEATTGQTAIEIIKNEPYDDPVMGKGQYTHKVYHIAGRCPRIIQAIAPVSALKIEERAWNAYPYCKTVFTNEFLGERFHLSIESIHLPDDGSTENALECDQKVLAKRKVTMIDIRNSEDPVTKKDPHLDPSKVASEKAGRGPLEPGWQLTAKPLMCCYKLVTIKFQVFGLQGKLESVIDGIQRDLLVRFYKQVFCSMDDWFDLSMDDIRRIEDETKRQLEQKIAGMDLETKDKSFLAEQGKSSDPAALKMGDQVVENGADSTHDRVPRGM